MKRFPLLLLFTMSFGFSAEMPATSVPTLPAEIVEPTIVTAPVSESQRVWSAVEINATPMSAASYEWMPGSYNQKNGTALHVNFEWVPVDWYVGKFGIGFGSGFGWISNVPQAENIASNLYVVPLETYLSYRADFIENQVVVPFVKWGPSYSIVHQVRDNKGVKDDIWDGYYGMSYSIGGELFLNLIDRGAAGSIRRSIGVSGTYLTFEYRNSRRFAGAPNSANLSGEEYRMGLRFEI